MENISQKYDNVDQPNSPTASDLIDAVSSNPERSSFSFMLKAKRVTL